MPRIIASSRFISAERILEAGKGARYWQTLGRLTESEQEPPQDGVIVADEFFSRIQLARTAGRLSAIDQLLRDKSVSAQPLPRLLGKFSEPEKILLDDVISLEMLLPEARVLGEEEPLDGLRPTEETVSLEHGFYPVILGDDRVGWFVVGPLPFTIHAPMNEYCCHSCKTRTRNPDSGRCDRGHSLEAC